MPVAVEAMPPKPKTAGQQRNHEKHQRPVQHCSLLLALAGVVRVTSEARVRFAPGNPARSMRAFVCTNTRHSIGGLMQREVTPTEARSGVVSGRIITVLVISTIGAVIALGAWRLVRCIGPLSYVSS